MGMEITCARVSGDYFSPRRTPYGEGCAVVVEALGIVSDSD